MIDTTSWLCLSVIFLPLFSTADDVTCPLPRTITPNYAFGNKMNISLSAVEPGVYYQFFCTADFDMVPPESIRICQDNGTWSGVKQTCVLKEDAKCSDPTSLLPDHSIPDSKPDIYRIFHVLTLSCADGFVGRGNATVMCNYVKVWKIDFECKPECQDPELPDNSEISPDWSQSGYAAGEDVPVSCESGHRLLGLPEITCTTDKTWNIKFGCCFDSENLYANDGAVIKTLKIIYQKKPVFIFGPVLFVLLLIIIILAAMLCKKKKTRSCSVSSIRVSPAKTPTMSVHKDIRITLDPEPSTPPSTIKDMRSQARVVRNHVVLGDSLYKKLTHEHSFITQTSREDTF